MLWKSTNLQTRKVKTEHGHKESNLESCQSVADYAILYAWWQKSVGQIHFKMSFILDKAIYT